ncbi:hypothetical protein [Micromonospora sp. MA102]|uniref:hypothetical protein n=1 Tax=Micromonospora sp. MA102 TaxID=2952755 RepID=UPI0021C89CAC|nr:hypothetical protein [Micromonospora sp. MA102]
MTTTSDGIRANESGSDLIRSGPDTMVVSLNDPFPDIRICRKPARTLQRQVNIRAGRPSWLTALMRAGIR